MKTLRKGENFKRMPEKSINDYMAIKNLLNSGWDYCPKSEYKKTITKENNNKLTKENKKRVKK